MMRYPSEYLDGVTDPERALALVAAELQGECRMMKSADTIESFRALARVDLDLVHQFAWGIAFGMTAGMFHHRTGAIEKSAVMRLHAAARKKR